LPTLLALLEKGFARRNQPVRLLGVGVRLEEEHLVQSGQFTLFDDEPADEVIEAPSPASPDDSGA
jgi:DNA polymerase-4